MTMPINLLKIYKFFLKKYPLGNAYLKFLLHMYFLCYLGMLLVACIRHKRDYAVTVLSMLEVAITASITKNQIKRSH